MVLIFALCIGLGIGWVQGASVSSSPEVQTWTKPSAIPTESEAFQNRLEQPHTHFLLDGIQGFVSGREFYQSLAEVSPFLWATSPYLKFGPDRSWQNEPTSLNFHGSTGWESEYPIHSGEIGYQVFDALRIHAGLDQMDAFSSRTHPARLGLIGAQKPGDLAWMGENLPLLSQANLGGAYSNRGATLAAQANQGWWWTASPVSGQVYPWEGYNAELTYGVGEEFQLSLVGQDWNSPLREKAYHAHYGRSELNMSFLNSATGGWVWRLDVGYQRREMISDSVFSSFEQKTYPTRFRYRQTWQAPDSLPLHLISQGALSFRDRLISLQHSSEFQEKWGPHQFRQIIKGYYRRQVKGYVIPTEYLGSDSAGTAEAIPGHQARGLSSEIEFQEKRKTFSAELSVNHVMEWEAPLFHLHSLDTVAGSLIRHGAYRGSNYLLQNASCRIFAGGGIGLESDSAEGENANSTVENPDKKKPGGGFWRLQAGYRQFWGEDAGSMEFLPSQEWAGVGGGWAFPFQLRAEALVNYLGEKEVRGWGAKFKVPAHIENNLSLEQALFRDQLKLSLSFLHAFGEAALEHPNGNLLRFRIIGAVTGKF